MAEAAANLPQDEGDGQNQGAERVQPAPASKKFLQLIKSVKRQNEFVKSPALEDVSFAAGMVRHDRITQQWNDIDDLYMDIIENADDEAAKRYETMYAEVENIAIETLGILRDHVDTVRPANDHGQQEPSSESNQPAPRVEVIMPQQDIKNTWGKFCGDLTAWTGFRDRFVGAVHVNKDIEPAFKYQHLQKSLYGQAAEVLGQGAAQDAKTYEEAFMRLCNVYDDTYAICRAHIHELFQLPFITEPVTADQLRKMTSTTYEQIRQLKSHKVPVESWDLIICTLLHDRLPADLVRQWQLGLKDGLPTYLDLLEFLDKQAKALTNSTTGQVENIKVTIKNDRRTETNRKEKESKPSTSTGGQTRPRYPCGACGSTEHQIFFCPELAALNLNGKYDFVERRNICANCLKTGHKAENCYSVKCKHPLCVQAGKTAHNSILCPNKQKSTSSAMAASGQNKRSS